MEDNLLHLHLAACPDDATLGAFVEHRLPDDEAGRVLEHVAGCAGCRSRAKALTDWLAANDVAGEPSAEVTSMARRVWEAAQWRRVFDLLRPNRELLAAADGQSADQAQSENAIRSGFLHFVAVTPRGHRDSWRVDLPIMSNPTPDSLLRLTASDSEGRPIADGVLSFCGMELKIANGRAVITLGDFQRQLSQGGSRSSRGAVVLRRPDHPDVPGYPLLGGSLDG